MNVDVPVGSTRCVRRDAMSYVNVAAPAAPAADSTRPRSSYVKVSDPPG